MYGPEERRALLSAHGIAHRDDDQYYRSHPNVTMPGHYPAPSELELLTRSWREGDPSRTFVQSSIDTRASGPERGTVYRRRTINLDCAWCGGDSLLPAPGGPDAPFICGPCADDSWHARQAEAAEADLIARSQAAEIAEIVPLYDSVLGNPMRGRPAYRVATR